MRKGRTVAAALAGWLAATCVARAEQPLTVRVDAAGGAPRLVVNGEPVRARMFFGMPGSAPIRVGTNGQPVEFEFHATGSASNGTLHLRFGAQPGEVWLDNLEVTDLDTGTPTLPRCDFENGPGSFAQSWTCWPVGQENTVGTVTVQPGAGAEHTAGLNVRLRTPADGVWPDFHLYALPRLQIAKGHRYRARFWARAEPARDLVVAFYRPGQTFVHLGGPPDCFATQIRLAAGAGVDFVSFPADMPWPRPEEPADWSAVDNACELVLAANPRAMLIPRLGMDPPAWWRTAHPEAVMRWENGRRDRAVVASPLYRKEAAERLEAVVAHLEEKYGTRVAGYHPCGQNTGEWFYEGTWDRPLSGYAPEDLTAWRPWLRRRYRDDPGLQKAWRAPSARVDTAVAPNPTARHTAPMGVFRDPAAERPLIDWGEFQQEAMADCVRELARAVRRASEGRKLVLFFYGYVFEFGAVPNGPAVAGHYGLRRALACPDIDVLCSPISYHDRGPGQSAPSMTAAESVALAGKMWLNEDDTHTYLASGSWPGASDHAPDLATSLQELRRNVAQEALRNFATWWMDLGATGWFNDPALWDEMRRLRALDEPLLRHPKAFVPEVAAVLDERSIPRVAAGGNLVTRPTLYESRSALGRMGAPYGQYLLDDVLADRVPAKLQVFLNAWALSAAERAALRRTARGKTRVWCYAPGYFDEDRPSLDAMRELTGFRLEPVTPTNAIAIPTDRGRRLGLTASVGVSTVPRPLFRAADARDEEVLANYTDGSPAVALRRDGEGASLFVGPPGLTSEILRLAARTAGAHLHTETDCNVYANGEFVALHAAETGLLKLNLGDSVSVTDALTGEALGHGPMLELRMERGQTRVLRKGLKSK